MCSLVYVKDNECKKLLDNTIIGLSGFNKNNVHYFIITYDFASLAYPGEIQQGMFNAWVCTINFINGLHSKGIGSCCLQWSNNTEEDTKIRNALKLSKSERIDVVVGCGYYKGKNIIPSSVRKSREDVYRIV